jgi:hypothetical protein
VSNTAQPHRAECEAVVTHHRLDAINTIALRYSRLPIQPPASVCSFSTPAAAPRPPVQGAPA